MEERIIGTIKPNGERAYVSLDHGIHVEISYVDESLSERTTGRISIIKNDRDYDVDVNYLMPDETHLVLILQKKGNKRDIFSRVTTQREIKEEGNRLVVSKDYTLEFNPDDFVRKLSSLALRSAERGEGSQILPFLKDFVKESPKARNYVKYHLVVMDDDEKYEFKCYDDGEYEATKLYGNCYVFVSGKADKGDALVSLMERTFRGEVSLQDAKKILHEDFVLVSQVASKKLTLRIRDEKDEGRFYTFGIDKGGAYFEEREEERGILKERELSEAGAKEIFYIVHDAMRGVLSLKDVVAKKEELLSLAERQGKVRGLKR